jgi:hypothetical protein
LVAKTAKTIMAMAGPSFFQVHGPERQQVADRQTQRGEQLECKGIAIG